MMMTVPTKCARSSPLLIATLLAVALLLLADGAFASPRHLLDDSYVRAPPGGGSASVPFTTWPAGPPPTIFDALEQGRELFLADVPGNLESLASLGVGLVPGFGALPIGDVLNGFLPVVNTATTNLLTNLGAPGFGN